ncbi:MAG: OmpW family outer membrane protein [Hyphomicrobiaceae bacterium]
MNFGSIKHAAIAAAAMVVGAASPVLAGDNNGNFMVRLQGTYVDTQDKVNSLTLNGADIKALGQGAEVSNEFIPTATLTYFASKNIAVELFCCFAKVGVDGKGTILGPLGEVAETWIFPPILTLQYHFDPINGIKPYVGAGVQYIHFFNSKPGKSVGGSVEFDDSFGFALQAGVDVQLGGGWYANLDVKKVWLDTTVTWRDPLGPGNVIRSNVDIDPLIVSAGLGYRFNLEDLFGSRSAPAPLK